MDTLCTPRSAGRLELGNSNCRFKLSNCRSAKTTKLPNYRSVIAKDDARRAAVSFSLHLPAIFRGMID
jgi:hypothetical protein